MSLSRVFVMAAACALSLGFALPGMAQTWTVTMTAARDGKMLALEGGDLKITLLEKQFWTLHEVHYRKQLVVGQFGANGAVVNVNAEDGSRLKDPWIGTGHGKELLKSFVVELDGKPVELKVGAPHTADEVTLTKTSVIGPLDQTAAISFGKTADRFVEDYTFTTNRDLDPVFRFMYCHMHCNVNALTDWHAWLGEGKTTGGQCVQDDNAFQLNKAIRAVALFGPELGLGVAYVAPEVYKVSGRGYTIWDRKRDNKLYFTPGIPAKAPKGETFSYRVTVIPFAAKAADWKDAAAKVVEPLIEQDDNQAD